MSSETDSGVGDMLDYLPAEEAIIGKHRIGRCDVITTSERVIFLRKFPPMFIEVHYNEINNLEHRTTILWKDFKKALILLLIAAVIYYNNAGRLLVEPIKNILRTLWPDFITVAPVELMLVVIMWVSAVVGVYYLIMFIPSMRGYFRVSRKERAPVVIASGMTVELRSIIREIEELIRQKSMDVVQPAPSAAAMTAEITLTEENIRDLLYAKLKDIGDNKVILISSKSELHTQVVSNMLDILINQRDMGGVYLSISRPHEFILSTMEAAGIPSENVYFIDCISLMAGKGQDGKGDNVVYVENPSSLEEVSMYLDKMLSKVQKPKKFLFLDSLSSLLIYNTDKSVKEFTHFIINKVRLENIAGIIFSIEKKEAEDLVKTLTPMCDTEIKF